MAAPLCLTRTAHCPAWTVTVTWADDGSTTTDTVRAADAADAVVQLAGFLAVTPAAFSAVSVEAA